MTFFDDPASSASDTTNQNRLQDEMKQLDSKIINIYNWVIIN